MSKTIPIKIRNSEKTETLKATLEEFIELNKKFEICIPGIEIFFSAPFNVTLEQKISADLSSTFPLLSNNFYQIRYKIDVGELERDPILLSIIKVCYNLPEQIINQIRKVLLNQSVDKELYKFSLFSSFTKNPLDATKAQIFCYLVKMEKASLALENKSLFESKSFSVNFLLDIYTKLEELNDLLSIG